MIDAERYGAIRAALEADGLKFTIEPDLKEEFPTEGLPKVILEVSPREPNPQPDDPEKRDRIERARKTNMDLQSRLYGNLGRNDAPATDVIPYTGQSVILALRRAGLIAQGKGLGGASEDLINIPTIHTSPKGNSTVVITDVE